MKKAAVVLFCGGGGSSLGIEQAGIPTIGLDHWAPAVAVHNAAGMVAHMHDLSDDGDSALFRLSDLMDKEIPPTALLWASPPCQPFSTAGSRQGFDDKRDGWPWTLRIVAKRRPDVFIAENVEGMTHDGEPAQYLGRIVRALEEFDYQVRWRVLNCADYGVPQTRRRLFIVARRDGGPITWPTPTHSEIGSTSTKPWVTMAEALGWGAWMQTRTLAGVINSMIRSAPTVTCQSGWQWVDDAKNPLLLSDLGKLQGFPADYPWHAAKGRIAACEVIGNAVPPIMARLLVEANRPEVWP